MAKTILECNWHSGGEEGEEDGLDPVAWEILDQLIVGGARPINPNPFQLQPGLRSGGSNKSKAKP